MIENDSDNLLKASDTSDLPEEPETNDLDKDPVYADTLSPGLDHVEVVVSDGWAGPVFFHLDGENPDDDIEVAAQYRVVTPVEAQIEILKIESSAAVNFDDVVNRATIHLKEQLVRQGLLRVEQDLSLSEADGGEPDARPLASAGVPTELVNQAKAAFEEADEQRRQKEEAHATVLRLKSGLEESQAANAKLAAQIQRFEEYVGLSADQIEDAIAERSVASNG